MTLTELRYMVALAQTRNFHRAAAQCAVSQPALSFAIKKLERRLGVVLFERLPRDIRLTQIGVKVLAKAQHVLDAVESLQQCVMQNTDETVCPFFIGAINTVAPYVYPKLIPAIRQANPQMPLHVAEGYTDELIKQLQAGKLDAILIAQDIEIPGIISRKLYEEPFVALLPLGHPMADVNAKLNITDLDANDVILLERGNCLRDQVVKACAYNDLSEAKLLEGGSITTLFHMVASGMGVSFIPSSAIETAGAHSGVVVKRFAQNPPTRIVRLAWRITSARTKSLSNIIRALSAIDLHEICII